MVWGRKPKQPKPTREELDKVLQERIDAELGSMDVHDSAYKLEVVRVPLAKKLSCPKIGETSSDFPLGFKPVPTAGPVVARVEDYANRKTRLIVTEGCRSADGTFAAVPVPANVEGGKEKGIQWVVARQKREGSYPGSLGRIMATCTRGALPIGTSKTGKNQAACVAEHLEGMEQIKGFRSRLSQDEKNTYDCAIRSMGEQACHLKGKEGSWLTHSIRRMFRDFMTWAPRFCPKPGKKSRQPPDEDDVD